MTFRKSIFWVHLVAGLAVGIVVAIMSATGIAIAFEHEILDWIDRDVKTVVVPANISRMTLEQLDASVSTQKPDFKSTTRVVPRELDQAYEYRAGRDGTLFVDPYTGVVSEPKSSATRSTLRTLTAWHRYLGMEGEGRETGKLITGIANLGFLFLCISGVYMWWPRSWSPKAWRPAVWFVGRIKGRARDFNWHNVFGSWSAIVLIVVVMGATIISFQWANRLVYTIAGEEPPQRGAQQGPAPVVVPVPEPGQERLTRDAILARVAKQYPQWESITFESAPGGANPGGNTQRRNDSAQVVTEERPAIRPVTVAVLNPALYAQKGRVQLNVDPFRGDVLSKSGFEDRSPANRARSWLRFLHTGEAFGFIGKVIATLASIGSLFLVYTGIALSCRRFFPAKPKTAAVAANTATESAY